MSYVSECLADSPLWMPLLDETSGTTMADGSGNGRDGTYTATPTLGVTGLDGGTGTAVTFNGSSQYGQVASAAWQNGLTAVTLEALIKGTDADGTIISKSNSSSPYRLGVSGGKAFMAINTGTITTVTGAVTVNDGTKHHVAGTWDGTTIRLYVDGVADGTAAKSGTISSGADASSLRVSQRANDSFLGDTIDNPAMYGTTLSAARILAHSNASAGGAVTGTASLSLSASGTAQAATTATASLSLSASGSGKAAASGTAALTLSASGDARAATSGTAALSFTATGSSTSAIVATAALALAASGSGQAPVTGLAALTLSASGSGVAPIVGVAALSLSASGLAEMVVSGAASVELSAVGLVAVPFAGSAFLVLASAGTAHQPFRDIKVLALVDISRLIPILDASRNPAPIDAPRALTITEEVYL